jgi:hypothetical protein
MSLRKIKKVKSYKAKNNQDTENITLSDIKKVFEKLQDESDARLKELALMCKVESAK